MYIYYYAHAVEHGIKIGTTINYKDTISKYSRHGDKINEIIVVKCNNKSLDEILKKSFKLLNICVKIPNQATTEVYSMTHDQAIEILKYIEINNNISHEVIQNIISPISIWETKTVPLLFIKQRYGSSIIPYKYQRDPDIIHSDEIGIYIKSKYMERYFNLSNIVLCKSDIDDQYEIIDGNHRCLAISRINTTHPCLLRTIQITIYNIQLTPVELMDIFRDLNQAKPMSEIYIRDNYIESYRAKIIHRLLERYPECISNISFISYSTQISIEKINSFITSNVIVSLVKSRKIEGRGYEELLQIIINTNNILCSILDIEESIEEKYTTIQLINGNKKLTLQSFTKVYESICKMQVTHNKTRKKIDYRFMIGLVPQLDIIDIIDNIRIHYDNV
jgi:hypothetical protein